MTNDFPESKFVALALTDPRLQFAIGKTRNRVALKLTSVGPIEVFRRHQETIEDKHGNKTRLPAIWLRIGTLDELSDDDVTPELRRLCREVIECTLSGA